MRIPRKGEKGFTLIELLIVVAILGVLAAVVIPNVGRFIGRGETEAASTELSNIQTAVVSMMVDNGLAALPAPVGTPGTTNMGAFPDTTATLASKGADAAFLAAAITAGDITAEVLGYLLYGSQMVVDVDGDGTYDVGTDAINTVNYTAQSATKGAYFVDASGTVTQYSSGY